ncbi:DUF86 domain-containing protein [Arthrobacter liuii]|uniref:DUF86 domain-containing protein n=1 Tax=Arthrobacter liuii TaxID=1476996 RepID=A0ABQ2AWL1_9MICC|nr:HepT-like ribonuclease domain-containing protein [Arthrobacter liuii]GGI00106.1 hypothetical protein GCM10007170_36480 [Arthrobacter liuii]
MNHTPDGAAGGHFAHRKRQESTFSLAEAPPERILTLLEAMEQRLDWAREIVAEGEEAFNRPANWRSRESLKSISMDLNTAADRFPERVREQYPDIPWRALRGLRNILAHDYTSTRYDILWNTAKRDLPRVRSQLAALRADIEGQPTGRDD